MECFYYFFPSNTLKAKLVTWKKFSNGIIKHALLLYYFIILLLNEPSLSIDNIFTNAVQRNIQSSHHKEKLTPAFITGEKMCVGSCYEPQQCVAGIDLPLEAFCVGGCHWSRCSLWDNYCSGNFLKGRFQFFARCVFFSCGQMLSQIAEYMFRWEKKRRRCMKMKVAVGEHNWGKGQCPPTLRLYPAFTSLLIWCNCVIDCTNKELVQRPTTC